MDLALYYRVLRRWWGIVLVGLVLAVGLAFLSFVRVDPSTKKIAYRGTETWVSYTRLLVTEQGFPWGDLGHFSPENRPYADPSRFASLAVLYSQFATGDEVHALVRKTGPLNGTIEAAPVKASKESFSDTLPIISIAALSPTPKAAESLALREANALKQYIELGQQESGIKPEKRVELTLVNRPSPATLFAARSKTPPIVVFLSILIATIGLCFVLENTRPRRNKKLPLEGAVGKAA
jgi:hypothetical protein